MTILGKNVLQIRLLFIELSKWSRKAGSHGICKLEMTGWHRKELN